MEANHSRMLAGMTVMTPLASCWALLAPCVISQSSFSRNATQLFSLPLR